MTVSKKQQKHVNNYIKSNYDRINLTLPRDYKAEIKAAAAKAGKSVNQFIFDAIQSYIENAPDG